MTDLSTLLTEEGSTGLLLMALLTAALTSHQFEAILLGVTDFIAMGTFRLSLGTVLDEVSRLATEMTEPGSLLLGGAHYGVTLREPDHDSLRLE